MLPDLVTLRDILVYFHADIVIRRAQDNFPGYVFLELRTPYLEHVLDMSTLKTEKNVFRIFYIDQSFDYQKAECCTLIVTK